MKKYKILYNNDAEIGNLKKGRKIWNNNSIKEALLLLDPGLEYHEIAERLNCS